MRIAELIKRAILIVVAGHYLGHSSKKISSGRQFIDLSAVFISQFYLSFMRKYNTNKA